MPKRLLFTPCVLLFLLAWFTGCTSDRSVDNNDNNADSITADTLNIDSLEQLYGNNVMPVAADELFDDFFFNFAASSKLQKQRICFPLKVMRDGKEQQLEQAQWRTNHFYLQQGYCTGVFANEDDEQIINDTTIRQAAVQHINMKEKTVANYHFLKLKGAWMLHNITYTSIDNIANADFLNFYAHFATDTKFQKASLHAPVETTVPDPDSDFGTISGTFYPEQWLTFKPSVMPESDMYNVVYNTDGIKKDKKLLPHNSMRFVIRGIANGLSTTMLFKKNKNKWQLVSIAN